MEKRQLIREVAQTTGVDGKTVKVVLDAAFEAASRGLQSDARLAWPRFGVFTVKERPARTGRNPQTGEGIYIAARRTVTFRAAPSLRAGL